MIKKILKTFRPAPHIARRPDKEIPAHYEKMRWQVFAGIFIGYLSFYLLRNNFSLAMPYLQQEGISKTQLGLVLSAMPLAYGISKFVMAILSDRSNPRYFMATGLIISALLNMILGTQFALNSVALMFCLMFLSGWCQGMGWPAAARVMVHWYTKKERGTKASIWGISCNIGGALVAPLSILGFIIFSSWHSIFYFPAIISLLVAVFVLVTVRDTPQSEGLPPIEEYKKADYAYLSEAENKDAEKELTTKEILFKYIFVNKYIWFLAMANIFIYIIRYGVISWVPTYLKQAKGFSSSSSTWAYFAFEAAAIFGTLLSGWVSDKFFRAHRAPVSIAFMLLVCCGVLSYWLIPTGYTLYCYIALMVVGFSIYGPIMLVNIHAMDLVTKKAAGTAVGLVGLFGYVGGAVIASAVMGLIVDHFGWNGGFALLIVSCILAIFFLALTWNARNIEAPKQKQESVFSPDNLEKTLSIEPAGSALDEEVK